MPKTAEYKNYLFLTVPEDADWFEFNDPKEDEIVYQNNGNDDMILKIPPGSYQIIGKGDAIDWEGIVDSRQGKLINSVIYKDYNEDYNWYHKSTESGHSLLRSLGMEPGTTLIFKKRSL